ncbi:MULTISPECIES: hypothetical protein [unclassified Exiguobacterium]|uniref:DUF3885 domain-containing protein n=1 Tax=unclassified Exiguobacterium TaxID=2644629 RepID=UPI00103870D0|nr:MULTISPECIES: hypothetical protein [unclassified Exiguobacterium]TCI48170.1 hypothetical protein EVJ31_03800 [Exiguobacterium sp. SH5S32]TCI55057.1 hypothetical protein EVJ25_03795 [Exiguobacterium sp. SH1S4]TCI74849.1 hypothetical protein EVJ23_03790 [Exiguobacterium sp. SH1S1]
MQILRPDQFSGDPLTAHIELEETMSPYIESDVYNPAYFQAVLQKAHDLFDALFDEGDAILLVYHVYGTAFTPTHLFRFIRDRNARFKTTLTRSVLHEETIRTYTVAISGRSQLRLHALLEAICHQDFHFSPRLCRHRWTCPSIQFIHQTKNHVLFIYDDRGAYIRGTSPEHLEALKQKISPPFMPNRT